MGILVADFWVLVEWNDDVGDGGDVGRIAAIFLLMVDIHTEKKCTVVCLLLLSFLSLSRVDVAPL